jgi:hypothetical protein
VKGRALRPVLALLIVNPEISKCLVLVAAAEQAKIVPAHRKKRVVCAGRDRSALADDSRVQFRLAEFGGEMDLELVHVAQIGQSIAALVSSSEDKDPTIMRADGGPQPKLERVRVAALTAVPNSAVDRVQKAGVSALAGGGVEPLVVQQPVLFHRHQPAPLRRAGMVALLLALHPLQRVQVQLPQLRQVALRLPHSAE